MTDRPEWTAVLGLTLAAIALVMVFNTTAFIVFFQLSPLPGLVWAVLLGAAVVGWHVRRGASRELRALVRMGAPRAPAPAVLLAVVASLAAGAGVAAFLQVFGPTLEPDRIPGFYLALAEYAGSPLGFVALAALAAGVVPLVEELAFRGYIQHTLERWAGPAVAIPVAAAGFAAVHLGAPHWSILLIPLTVGAACGLAAWAFGSIWPAVAIHCLWNLGMASLGLLGDDPAPAVGSAPVLVTAAGVSLVGIGAFGWWLVLRDGLPAPGPAPTPTLRG